MKSSSSNGTEAMDAPVASFLSPLKTKSPLLCATSQPDGPALCTSAGIGINTAMDFRGRHSRRFAAQEWWALGARALVLALALFMVAPAAGVGEDLAFHASRPHGLTEMAALHATAPAEAAGPGLACHFHCGCHQVAPLQVSADVTPTPEFAGLVYARVAEIPTPIASDRLARPPRA